MKQPEILELCHIVNDLDAAIEHWTQFMGAGPFYVAEMPGTHEQYYKGSRTDLAIKFAFGFSGSLLIELLQQTNDVPSVFKEVMDARGEGYHHVMIKGDFDTNFKRLSGEGYEATFHGVTPAGERFALFDTRKDNHGFIEIMDLNGPSAGFLETIARAHREWDGKTNPVRSFFDLMPRA